MEFRPVGEELFHTDGQTWRSKYLFFAMKLEPLRKICTSLSMLP